MSKGKQSAAAENIKVLVRCRPLSEKELSNGHKSCVEMDLTAHTVAVRSIIGEPDRFTFDAVINNTFSQADIFMQFIRPLVDSVLDGFNATVFAYGQSGSGKTHTMTGVMEDPEMEGVIPRCFKYIFDNIQKQQNEKSETGATRVFSMYVSFVELYNGKVRDLLAKQQVTLDVRESKDHTFFVQGAHIPQVKFPEDIIRLMEEGTERRRTASTELNADSSRSHSLFTLVLECTETSEEGDTRSVTSKLNLVDLAGSERQGKTGASGDTLKEGCNINLSLSALGTVIDTIVKGGKHIPFRSSPLTMLLKDSLGGNSKTVMFANINPSERNLSETVSTLRFADRAKQIKNKPVINMDTKDQKIAELQALVNELREKLQKYETEGTEGLERELEELRERVGELEVELANSVQSRQADVSDYEAFQAKLTEERQTYNSRVVELEDTIAQLKNDAQIAESTVNDARLQNKELLQICSMYLTEEKREIHNVDELTSLLKDQAHGANSAELAQANTQLQALTAENKNLQKNLQTLQTEHEALTKESKDAVATSERKLKKLKKELQALREEQQQGITDGTAPASQGDLKKLQEAYSAVEKQMADNALYKKVTDLLEQLQVQHESLSQGTTKELSTAQQQLSEINPSTSEKELVGQFRRVVADGDTLRQARLDQVAQLYNLAKEMKRAVRTAQAVPLTFLGGDSDAARKALDEVETIDQREAETHMKVIAGLQKEMSTIYAHRNSLLEKIASSYPDLSVDLKKEVRQVLEENKTLRRQCESLESERSEATNRVNEELRNAASRDAQQKAANDAVATAARKEFDDKQKKWLDALKLDDNGAAALKLLREENETLKVKLEKEKEAVPVAAMESIKVELAEERQARETVEKQKERLHNELQEARKEVDERVTQIAVLEGKMNEQEKEFKRQLGDAQNSTEELNRLEKTLKERSNQLDQMRNLLEKQKSLIVKSNEKADQYQQKLKEARAEKEHVQEHYQHLLEEKDSNTQKLINLRLQEYEEERKVEIEAKAHNNKKLKKKINKLTEQLREMEEEFDKKVIECEDLRNALSDQKVEQLKLVRRMEHTAEEAEVLERKEQIQSTLEKAKTDRKKKEDLFARGEVRSAKNLLSLQ